MNQFKWLKWMMSVTTLLLIGCTDEPVEPMSASASHHYNAGIVLSAALSPDAEMVALLSDDKQVKVWDNRNQKLIQSWGPKDIGKDPQHLALSGNKRRLAVAEYWTVTMLNVEDGSAITNWDVQGFNEGATVARLHLDESGYNVLVGMSDGAVLSISLKTGKALKLDHHQNQITNLVYGKDTQYAASGSTDKNFAYWRTDNGEVIFNHDFRSRVTAMALDTQSDKVFVSDALSSHWIIDARSGDKLTELSYFERFRYFRKAMFVQNGKYLVTSSPKDVVTLWHADSGEEVLSWQIQRYTSEASVWDMTLNSKGELVTLSSDGAVQNWNIRKYL